MSITSEINRLKSAKTALKTSIEGKGVTVPSATKIDGYASLVDQISGGAPQKFVIRPDAELVHKWTADELLVEDLGITLPAYATSAKTIKTGAALSPTITVDYTNYDYYVTMRGLAIPIYNTTTKVKGRCDFTATGYLHELVVIPANEIQSVDGSKKITSRNAIITANGSVGRELYWSSASAIAVANNATYGAYVTGQAPTISGTTLTVKAPIYGIRGNTNQMTSTAWGQMTDIREQYVIEVWRAPKDDVEGWGLTTSVRDVVEAVQNGGNLYEGAYTITNNSTLVSVSATEARAGDVITITEISTQGTGTLVTVKTSSGTTVVASVLSHGASKTFTMPSADVVINASVESGGGGSND